MNMTSLFIKVTLLILLISGCSQSHLEIFPQLEDPSLMDRQLTVEQMHSDVDALVEGVLLRHPDIGTYADPIDLDQAVAETKAQIETPMTRVQFYRVIGQLSHYFNDGHVFLLWPYPEMLRAEEAGAHLLPFEVVMTKDEAVLLKYDYVTESQLLKAGSRIVALNGMPIEEIMQHLQRFVGGESEYLRKQIVVKRFSRTLSAAMGWEDDFVVELSVEEQPLVVNVHASQNWSSVITDNPEDYYFSELQPGVGMFYLGHFDIDPGEFERFVDQSFELIKKSQIRTLIIDIRDNPGGNTDTVTYLARHLASKPFRLVSSVREKINPDNKGWLHFTADVGDIVSSEWNDWESPVKEDKLFAGDTYVLIGPASYSAAIVFATTMKDHQFATLVGEATEGFANQTAQGNLFNLPHSQLRAYVATRSLVRPNGEVARMGVQPHYEIFNQREDVKQGRDASVAFILDRAIDLVDHD